MTNIGVEQIEQMERGALITLWQELIDKPLPRHMSIVFLRQVLALKFRVNRTVAYRVDLLRCSTSKQTDPNPNGRRLSPSPAADC